VWFVSPCRCLVHIQCKNYHKVLMTVSDKKYRYQCAMLLVACNYKVSTFNKQRQLINAAMKCLCTKLQSCIDIHTQQVSSHNSQLLHKWTSHLRVLPTINTTSITTTAHITLVPLFHRPVVDITGSQETLRKIFKSFLSNQKEVPLNQRGAHYQWNNYAAVTLIADKLTTTTTMSSELSHTADSTKPHTANVLRLKMPSQWQNITKMVTANNKGRPSVCASVVMLVWPWPLDLDTDILMTQIPVYQQWSF